MLTYMAHYYGGKDGANNLMGSSGLTMMMSWVRYLFWGK